MVHGATLLVLAQALASGWSVGCCAPGCGETRSGPGPCSPNSSIHPASHEDGRDHTKKGQEKEKEKGKGKGKGKHKEITTISSSIYLIPSRTVSPIPSGSSTIQSTAARVEN